MKINKPAIQTVNTGGGTVTILHQDDKTKRYAVSLVSSGSAIASVTYEVPQGTATGATLNVPFSSFKLRYLKKVQSGSHDIRVIGKADGHEDSDVAVQAVNINQDEADTLNRVMKKHLPWIRIGLCILALIGIVLGAMWLGSRTPRSDQSGSQAAAALSNAVFQAKSKEIAEANALIEAANRERDEATNKLAQAQIAVTPATNAEPDALTGTSQPAATNKSELTSTSTNASSRTQGRPDVKLTSQLNIPQGTTMQTGKQNVTGNNNVVGNIFNAPTYIVYEGSQAPQHVHQGGENPTCVKTGWLGDDSPTHTYEIPPGMSVGETNIVLEPGDRFMVLVPANVTFFPDVNDATRFHFKVGDDCGKQGSYTNRFGPGHSPKKVHGYYRVLITAKSKEECEKEGWSFMAAPFYFKFFWRPKAQ